MGPIQAVKAAYSRSFDFTGRSSRSEFWWFFVYCATVVMLFLPLSAFFILLASPFDEYTTKLISLIPLILFYFHIIPYIAAAVRRLHDTGRSGMWLFVPIIPIFYLFFASHDQENKYRNDTDENQENSRKIFLYKFALSILIISIIIFSVFFRSSFNN